MTPLKRLFDLKDGASLVLLAALIFSGRMLFGVLKRAGRQDPIAVSERRFAPLRAYLKGRPGPLGYLTDVPPGFESDKRFNAAQFAFAPILLLNAAEFQKGSAEAFQAVVGDFSGGNGPALARAAGLRVAKDFGQGVFLLSSPPSP